MESKSRKQFQHGARIDFSLQQYHGVLKIRPPTSPGPKMFPFLITLPALSLILISLAYTLFFLCPDNFICQNFHQLRQQLHGLVKGEATTVSGHIMLSVEKLGFQNPAPPLMGYPYGGSSL